MDVISHRYTGTFRDWNGNIFTVAWAAAADTAAVFTPGTPFRSGHGGPLGPFDTGWIGEIPQTYSPGSTAVVPSRVCGNCYVGVAPFWTTGWDPSTPPVILGGDGWALGCSPEGAYDDAYAHDYDVI